jgi:hypothetical protein
MKSIALVFAAVVVPALAQSPRVVDVLALQPSPMKVAQSDQPVPVESPALGAHPQEATAAKPYPRDIETRKPKKKITRQPAKKPSFAASAPTK